MSNGEKHPASDSAKKPAGAGGEPRRKQGKAGRETRTKIIEATLTTVLTEGLVGTSARAIARTGDFNQALVFYHFGSIEELLIAALETAHQRRMEQCADRFLAAETVADMVAIGEDLLAGESRSDHSAVVAIVGGWPANSPVGRRILEIMRPWDQMVQESLARCLSGTIFVKVLPVEALSYAASSMVLGMELTRRLDGDDPRPTSVLRTFAEVAAY